MLPFYHFSVFGENQFLLRHGSIPFLSVKALGVPLHAHFPGITFRDEDEIKDCQRKPDRPPNCGDV
jgi:hypothetical protein